MREDERPQPPPVQEIDRREQDADDRRLQRAEEALRNIVDRPEHRGRDGNHGNASYNFV